MAAPKDRDPITTHVLDTTTGLPAKGVNVILSVEGSDKNDFFAETNSDGRITNWKDRTGVTVPTVTNSHDGKMVWRLSYKVEEYYGEGENILSTRSIYSSSCHRNPKVGQDHTYTYRSC